MKNLSQTNGSFSNECRLGDWNVRRKYLETQFDDIAADGFISHKSLTDGNSADFVDLCRVAHTLGGTSTQLFKIDSNKSRAIAEFKGATLAQECIPNLFRPELISSFTQATNGVLRFTAIGQDSIQQAGSHGGGLKPCVAFPLFYTARKQNQIDRIIDLLFDKALVSSYTSISPRNLSWNEILEGFNALRFAPSSYQNEVSSGIRDFIEHFKISSSNDVEMTHGDIVFNTPNVFRVGGSPFLDGDLNLQLPSVQLDCTICSNCHGDLNPRNILIARAPELGASLEAPIPKIIDFERYTDSPQILGIDFARLEAGLIIAEGRRANQIRPPFFTGRLDFSEKIVRNGSIPDTAPPAIRKLMLTARRIRSCYLAKSTTSSMSAYFLILGLILLGFLRGNYAKNLSMDQRKLALWFGLQFLHAAKSDTRL